MALSTSLLGSMLAAAAAHDASNKGAGMASPPNGGDYVPAGQSTQDVSAPSQTAVSGGMMGAMLGGGAPVANPRQYSTPAGPATPTYWSQPPQNGPVGTKSINTPSGSMVLGSSLGNASGEARQPGANLGAGGGSSLFGPLTVDYKGAALPAAPNFMTPPASGADNAPIPYKPTAVAPPPDYTEDPRIQDLRDAAKHLYDHAAELDPPKHPGLSLAQALVGIAGAVATQGNPKAQFVASYLPSLGKAIEDKYGDSQQAWQVARQNVLNQAQAMATQAEEMQKAGLQRHQIDTGYYGKTAVAGMNAQGRLDVEALKQNGLGIRAALSRAGKDGATAARLITSEDPNARIQGYDILRKNGLNGWTDDHIAEAAQTETAKQALQMAAANFKNVTAQPTADNLESSSGLKDSQAGLADARTATENTLRSAKLAIMKSIPGLNDARAAELAEKTKLMPEQAAAAVGRAQAYADYVAGSNQYRQGSLDARDLAEAGAMVKSGLKAVTDQADTLRKGQAALANQLAKTKDDAQRNNIEGQISDLQVQIGKYQKMYGDLSKSAADINKRLMPATPAFTPGPRIVGSIGRGGTVQIVPQGQAPEPSPLDVRGMNSGGASKAAAIANQKKTAAQMFDPVAFQKNPTPGLANEYNKAVTAIQAGRDPNSVWSMFAKKAGMTYKAR